MLGTIASDEIWPSDGLERVKQCPVCGNVDRELLHEGLHARERSPAAGKWTLFRCQGCGSAYLDPRQTPDTIGLAYGRYFTHKPYPRYEDLSWPRRIQRIFANGYRNYRFGTSERPASRLRVLAALLLPAQRAMVDAAMRHLPRPVLAKDCWIWLR